MPNPYHHPADVLRFATDQDKYALVVVTAVTGGAMRAPGALMCVSGSGEVAGYISNGCVDADIIYHARHSLEVREAVQLCYGDGSPFKDIQLPCGGRIDLWVLPYPSKTIINQLSKSLHTRQSTRLSINANGELLNSKNTSFSITYNPKLKLRIVGRGEAVWSLVKQAVQTGFEIILQSPEPGMGEGLVVQSFEHLTDPANIPNSDDDPWTAVVLMFHDHEWEPEILSQALSGPAFYIGAMGSPRTHKIRKAALQERGIPNKDIDRIHGPIGLIPSMRDANLLALSTLAEIVKIAQESGRS